MTRILFAVLIAALAIVYGAGQGWWGTQPADLGRDPARIEDQSNETAIQLKPAAR